MDDQEEFFQMLIQLMQSQGQQLPQFGGLLADNSGISTQTIRGMRDAGLLSPVTPIQTSGQPTYDTKRGQEYYDQRQRRDTNGIPMTEESYQKLQEHLKRVGKR